MRNQEQGQPSRKKLKGNLKCVEKYPKFRDLVIKLVVTGPKILSKGVHISTMFSGLNSKLNFDRELIGTRMKQLVFDQRERSGGSCREKLGPHKMRYSQIAGGCLN